MDFWFPGPGFHRFWFSQEVDKVIRLRFEWLLPYAHGWPEDTLRDHIAKIILLDQFPRNLFRDQLHQLHQFDPEALNSSLRFIQQVDDLIYSPTTQQLVFALLPWRHQKTEKWRMKLMEWCSTPSCPIDDNKLWYKFTSTNDRVWKQMKN